MASTEPEIIVLEQCEISLLPGLVPNKSLPLTFFDLLWINYTAPIQCLLFYDNPQTRTQFLQTTVPNLKNSLSAALKHYFPLSGNLVSFPSTSGRKPEIVYKDGDSVSLTFAECVYDFNYLTNNKIARNSDQFLPLLAQLPPSFKASDNSTLIPLLSLKVTLFPDHGICIGITHNHIVGDGSSMAGFRKAWALITEFNSDAPLLAEGQGLLPFYDRSVIKVPDELFEFYWNIMQMFNDKEPLILQSQIPPISVQNTVRSSFIVNPEQILQLKKIVLDRKPNIKYVSTFVVVCGYVWSCLAKIRVPVGEDEMEYFTCPINARTRLNPPIPPNYFGNCLAPFITMIKSTKLLGEEGFANGAELVGKDLSKMLNNEEEVLKDAKNWVFRVGEMKGREVLGVTGSPKFSLHDIDFGWGMPKKFELGFHGGSVSLNGCKDFESGVEIGLALREQKMNHFADIFINGLNDIMWRK